LRFPLALGEKWNLQSSVLRTSPDLINPEEPEEGEEEGEDGEEFCTCSLTPIMAMQFPFLA